jgi:hypothetical protein
MRRVQRFILTIEGPGWTDSDDVELVRLPEQGEPIETRYGTCVVTRAEPLPDSDHFDGRIICRLPG